MSETHSIEQSNSQEQDDAQALRNWPQLLDNLSYANGEPEVFADIKASPEDFVVTEQMDVEPTGEGEHIWLDITKVRRNTDAVAKSLARFAGVANRDVGYSGLKDFDAVTRQWFSVWRPKGAPLDLDNYQFDGVTINSIKSHSRKIKRGTHRSNHFQIRLKALELHSEVLGTRALNDDALDLSDLKSSLEARLNAIQKIGAPNYFGTQRFGRNAGNLPQALAMFNGDKRVKDRNLRGILLSSARSWLFNSVLSQRIVNGSWQRLFIGEPANLDSTNSVFTVENELADVERLKRLDIHPTAPLWGQGSKESISGFSEELLNLETTAMAPYADLQIGVENARIDYQRRAIRLAAKKLTWRYEQTESNQIDCILDFELNRGQFATSILRELVSIRPKPVN